MVLETIAKYFPPPSFLKPTHIGISFSDSNIKAVYFDRLFSKPRIESIVVSLEKGVIVEGRISNAESVVKALSTIRQKFASPFVFFTIPDELTYVFSVSIPVISPHNITESVAFSIEENVPLLLSDTIFDFKPIKIVQSNSEYKATVVVAACVKKEVEKFVDVIHRSGLEVVGCIHESQAIALSVVPKDFKGTVHVVHARKNRIGIYLLKDNVVLFSTIRSVLEGDYKKQFLDEYEKFLEYCSKYNISEEMPKVSIFVCGDFEYGKSAIESLLDYKGSTKDAKLSNVWSNVLEIERDTPEISYEDSLALAGPIGAVLASTL